MEAFKKLIGKKVIIRSICSSNNTIFFGTLNEAELLTNCIIVELINSRKVFYYTGARSIQELASKGTSEEYNCEFSVIVNKQIISNVCEIIPCTDIAIKSIERVKECVYTCSASTW